MRELQQVIDETTGQLAHAAQAASYRVLLGTDEAKALVDAAQLVSPLQERCELLTRALNGIYTLVSGDTLPAGVPASETLDALLTELGVHGGANGTAQ